MKKNLISAGLILFCAVFCTSCIVFEQQTLSYKYYKGNDTLRIFQVYDGIYLKSDFKETSPTKGEKGQFASLFSGERTFFFANWIFEYDKASLKKYYSKEVPEKISNPGTRPSEKTFYKEAKVFLELLFKNVKVENGKFYMNEKKQLSGYQYVTINNASRIIKQANKLISAEILDILSKENKFPEDFRKKLKKAASEDFQWITIKGNMLQFQIFAPSAAFKDLKRDLFKKALSEAEASNATKEQLISALQPQFDLLIQNDVWISYLDNTMTLTIGNKDDDITELQALVHPSYKANAVDYVKGEYGIEEQLDLKKLKEKFFKPAWFDLPSSK